MRTVVIADTVMGLDNVLAVAGAAHGSFLLVVARPADQHPDRDLGQHAAAASSSSAIPAFVYVGAGVLAWTSVKMMTAEPLRRRVPRGPSRSSCRCLRRRGRRRAVRRASCATIARSSRASARASRSSRRPPPAAPTSSAAPTGDIRHAEDPGSRRRLAQRAARRAPRHRRVPQESRLRGAPAQRADAVLAPRRAFVAQAATATRYHKAQAEAVLAPLREMLEEARVPFAEHIRVGQPGRDDRRRGASACSATTSCSPPRARTRSRAWSRRRSPTACSTSRRCRSKWWSATRCRKLERYGIPVGIGAGLGALVLLAAD